MLRKNVKKGNNDLSIKNEITLLLRAELPLGTQHYLEKYEIHIWTNTIKLLMKKIIVYIKKKMIFSIVMF